MEAEQRGQFLAHVGVEGMNLVHDQHLSSDAP